MSAHDHRSAAELGRARQAIEALRGISPDADAVEITVAGTAEPVDLPRAALEPLREILANLAAGRDVTVVPANAELTTQKAAEILGVSRLHLIRLLHEGRIRYRLVGRHRRVLASSLLEYRRGQHGDRGQADEDSAALSEGIFLS
ncbi:helix-turn-helix domain-containing protein [Nocardia higoensis]|uniref:Helix-turn-helix domain-containing protein n=1 Tax=Nocardia higoensis TaxID=228599 RepID=A0ABS0DHS2_9NOCA|nr:helix-turn-helix domain-containing protein [Nocardia higoensis]MBF6356489.1 helix-turn-helix domain-containing protein [Nocardia higoensis]